MYLTTPEEDFYDEMRADAAVEIASERERERREWLGLPDPDELDDERELCEFDDPDELDDELEPVGTLWRYPDKPIDAGDVATVQCCAGPEALLQPKYDGHRTLAEYDGRAWFFRTRTNRLLPLDAIAPAIRAACDALALEPGTVLDGELLGTRRAGEPAQFAVFGITYESGLWLGGESERYRAALLADRLADLPAYGHLAENIDNPACAVFVVPELLSTEDAHVLADARVEGIVGKRADARLVGDFARSAINPRWFKWRRAQPALVAGSARP